MFELNQQFVIEHQHSSRGKNDESVVLLHIKLRCDALPVEASAAALRARGPGEVQQAFFSDSKPRFLGMDVIPIDHEYEAKHQIKIDELEQCRAIKVFNIKLLPLIEGHFSATFTVTVEDPSADFLHYIANAEHTSVDVHLIQDVRELDLDKLEDPVTEGKKPGKVKKTERNRDEQAPLIN